MLNSVVLIGRLVRDPETEEWRDVPGWEAYEVSNTGRVRSKDRHITHSNGTRRIYHGKELKCYTQHDGYRQAHLRNQSRTRNTHVHRLVAEAFLGPCPDGYEVCHCDGNPSNNHVSNLRYDTRAGNHADKLAHGTAQRGEKNGASKLTLLKVMAIKELLRLEWSQSSIADIFSINPSTVSLIRRGKKWGWVEDKVG